MSRAITLTTDFGLADGFPAAMRGAIMSIAPDVRVIDVAHEAAPFAVAHASFVLGAVAPHFQAGTIHVAVVDPGVGTERAPLVVVGADDTVYVGPDSGVFSHALARGQAVPGATHDLRFMELFAGPLPDGASAFRIEDPAFMSAEVSATFHGRDVFARCAARLTLGASPEEVGPAARLINYLNLPGPRRSGGSIIGRVQYVDRFGNLATDIPAGLVTGTTPAVRVRGRSFEGLADSYRATGDLGAVSGSHGFLEIASYAGSAAASLGAALGDEVCVEL